MVMDLTTADMLWLDAWTKAAFSPVGEADENNVTFGETCRLTVPAP
jgi:hypothetical protein